MDLWHQQALFAKSVAALLDYIFKQGYSCTLGECYRTPEQAQIYCAEGKGIINSLHCDRLALDICLFSPEGLYLKDTQSYKEFGSFWESLDNANRWGGNFPQCGGKLSDANHFERKKI